MRDRKMLAQDGFLVIVASINTKTGKLKKSPDIISRGFVYLRESQDLLNQARMIIKKTVEETTQGMNPINFDFVKSTLSDNVGRSDPDHGSATGFHHRAPAPPGHRPRRPGGQ